MKIRIPKENKDIRAAVRNKILLQCIVCVLWTAAVMTVAWLTNTLDSQMALVLYTIISLIPFVKFKIWRWLFDRAFEGEIINRKDKQRVDSTRPFNPTVGSLVRVFDQNLAIRQKDGRVKTVRVTRKNGENAPEYREGDHVRHYYGTKYMQIITDQPDAPCVCVMCGTAQRNREAVAEPFGEGVCGVCGKSLIDHRK